MKDICDEDEDLVIFPEHDILKTVENPPATFCKPLQSNIGSDYDLLRMIDFT